MTPRATEAVDEAVRGRALLRSGGALPGAELARETGRSARRTSRTGSAGNRPRPQDGRPGDPLRPGPTPAHGRAVAAGARITAGLHEADYGSRDFAAAHPQGNHWYFGTYPGAPRPVPGC